MIKRIASLLLSLSFSYSQEIIGEGLSGQPLLDYVVNNYKTSTTLGYNTARDTLYGTIDLQEGNQLSCVYSGYTITLDTTLDPSTDAYNQGINCEHTYPQSMGASEEPQKSDMHHLFPCKSNVNSSRGNDPYAEIPDEDTDTWYRNDYSQDTIPTEYIEEYAEKYNPSDPTDQTFEPREDHKGDASRAVFYFFAMYNDVADTNFWNVQKDVLIDWHYYDEVNDWELNRTWAIASYQENQPNPFVLDSSLARRIWYMDDGGTDTSSTDTTEYNIIINEIMQNPSAVSDSEGEWFEIYNNSEEEIDLNGFIIKDNDTDSHTVSSTTIVQPYSYAVLGRNADYSANGGVYIDYEYSSVNLANGADEIILIDSFGETVDSVAYDGGTNWPDPNGATMALLEIGLDNNLGENWVEYDSTTYGDGDYGTPGYANFPEIDACDSGFVQIDTLCYWESDIAVLQAFIDNSQGSSNPPPSDLSPIELGSQVWEEGRLVNFCASSEMDGCETYTLAGNFPENIGNLSELQTLILSNNELTGTFPLSFFELINLRVLYLDGNELSDSLSQSFGNLTNLESLNISHNNFTGIIPNELGNISSLVDLVLRYNNLNGTIPSSLFDLPNLEALYLDNNQITGEIPPNIGSAASMYYINLSSNQLEGDIPSNIVTCASLAKLLLGDNQLTGSIPEEIWTMVNLERLFLDSNELTGELPDAIGNLTNLYALSLYSNQLSGIIPDSICNLTNIEEVNLWNNQFCPPYPECISEWSIGDQDTSNCEPLGLDDIQIPFQYSLYQNYPNPFNPVTTLRYDLPEDALVNITIYDMMGRVVKTLINDQQTAGYRSTLWNATNNAGSPVSAGIYLYMIQAGDFRQTRKMVLLK